jgi:hypothetical protein
MLLFLLLSLAFGIEITKVLTCRHKNGDNITVKNKRQSSLS